MKVSVYKHARGAVLYLFTLSLFLLIWIPDVQAQQTCTEKLAQAEQLYENIEPGEAIALLRECLETNEFTEQEQISAYRLLALCHISNEQPSEARDAVANLLTLSPGYQVNPDQDPPDFITMIEEYRAANQRVVRPPDQREQPVSVVEPQKQKRGLTKWLLIGGGVVAGGVVAAVLLGGNGNDNLPEAPPLPGGN